MKTTSLIILLFTSLTSASVAAEWPQWRGPFLNGSSDETGLPESWGPKTNVRWSADLPGEGASTPVIQGGRVFLTSTDRGNKNLYAICIDSKTGREIWRIKVDGNGKKVPYNKQASPSPVADAKNSYFLFGSGEFFAVSADGKIVWRRNVEEDFGPFTHQQLYAASPLLYRGRLYLSLLRDFSAAQSPYAGADSKNAGPLDSYVICIDAATGNQIWKCIRQSEIKGVESRESYATPIPYDAGENDEILNGKILVTGANYLTAHDWKTGDEAWRMRFDSKTRFRQRIVPTPLVMGELIVGSLPRFGPLFALAPRQTGTIPYSTIAWEYEDATPDVPSPLAYRGRIYFLHDSRGILTCLDPKTGHKIWDAKLGAGALFHASPTAADDKIYCIDLDGDVFVVEAADKFKLHARVSMEGSPCMSTISVAYACLFIRTEAKLYCIGSHSND